MNYSKEVKLSFVFDNGKEKREISHVFSNIVVPEPEEIMAIARLMLVTLGYDVDLAKGYVFVDEEERKMVGVDEGSFYGSV